MTRPAVEAGENLGFLPGDLKEKLDPYMQPLYDALRDMIPHEKLMQHLEKVKENKSGKKVRKKCGGTQRIPDGRPGAGSSTARGAGGTSEKFGGSRKSCT